VLVKKKNCTNKAPPFVVIEWPNSYSQLLSRVANTPLEVRGWPVTLTNERNLVVLTTSGCEWHWLWKGLCKFIFSLHNNAISHCYINAKGRTCSITLVLNFLYASKFELGFYLASNLPILAWNMWKQYCMVVISTFTRGPTNYFAKFYFILWVKYIFSTWVLKT
jgi:hypothetical protein